MPGIATDHDQAALTFPKDDIVAELSALLEEEVESQTAAEGALGTPAVGAGTVRVQVVIDSLVALEIVMAVEPLIGPTGCVPESVVRAGGYNSPQECISHVLPKLETIWMKYNKESSHV